MALFGAPVAHEDHAVRACYAALTMQEAVRRQQGLDVQMCVGVNSGEVVVRAIGNDLHMDYSEEDPYGDPTTIATAICPRAGDARGVA